MCGKGVVAWDDGINTAGVEGALIARLDDIVHFDARERCVKETDRREHVQVRYRKVDIRNLVAVLPLGNAPSVDLAALVTGEERDAIVAYLYAECRGGVSLEAPAI